MARKKVNWVEVLMLVLTTVASVGIAGLFLNGTFLNTFLLSLFPEVVHTGFGWALLVAAFVPVFKLFKKFF